MIKKNKMNKTDKTREWVNIRVSPDTKYLLIGEKAQRQLLTYDQVIRELLKGNKNFFIIDSRLWRLISNVVDFFYK